MSIVRIAIRTDAFSAALQDAQLRQYPFVISLGINRLGNLAQAAQRDGMREHLTLRRAAWNLNAIKISKTDRASKTSWNVTIFLDPRADYLKRMEDEGIHEPIHGRSYLWVPDERVFRNRIIRAEDPLAPRNLHMHKDGNRIIGDQRTFMVKGAKGPLVIQRLGKGSGTSFTSKSMAGINLNNFGQKRRGMLKRDRTQGTQVLYHLRERVTVPLKLEFVETISRTVNTQAPRVMREALAWANSRRR